MARVNPHFDAIAQGCGYEKGDITRTAGGLIGKAVRELMECGATPEEILRRCAVYHEKYPGFDLTVPALLKHWPGLKPAKEDQWSMCVRIAKEKGLEPFRGAVGNPPENREQFMARVSQSNVINL